jgi:hypothetical protein
MSLLLVQYRGGRNTPADEKHAKGGRMAEVLLFHHAQGQTEGFAMLTRRVLDFLQER